MTTLAGQAHCAHGHLVSSWEYKVSEVVMDRPYESAIRKAWANDGELASALFILESPLIQKKAAAHVDAVDRAIDWDAILDSCYSSSERLVAQAARALWDAGAPCSLGQLQWHLDDREMVRVLAAALLGRALVSVDEAYSMLGSISERRPVAEGHRAFS